MHRGEWGGGEERERESEKEKDHQIPDNVLSISNVVQEKGETQRGRGREKEKKSTTVLVQASSSSSDVESEKRPEDKYSSNGTVAVTGPP